MEKWDGNHGVEAGKIVEDGLCLIRFGVENDLVWEV